MMTTQRNRLNHEAEERLQDHSALEERAVEIARMEGRDIANEDDRARAREELLAPNESTGDPEVAPELGGQDLIAWDEAPESSGHQVPRVKPDDEKSIGKTLIEDGLRGPRPSEPRM